MSWNVTQCETKLFCEKMGTGSGLTLLCGFTEVQTRAEKTSEKPDLCCLTWPLSRTPQQITLSNAITTKLANCVWENVGADIISMKRQADVKPPPRFTFLTTRDGFREALPVSKHWVGQSYCLAGRWNQSRSATRGLRMSNWCTSHPHKTSRAFCSWLSSSIEVRWGQSLLSPTGWSRIYLMSAAWAKLYSAVSVCKILPFLTREDESPVKSDTLFLEFLFVSLHMCLKHLWQSYATDRWRC